jgi:hypothetical protein
LEQARRAIYVDFEGRKNEEPAVLGTLWMPSSRSLEPTALQYVLEGGLARAKLPGVTPTPLQGELKSLLRRCRKQDRVLVGWSLHEVNKVREFVPELAEAFDALYRDAKSSAKAWRSTLHPDLLPPHEAVQPKHRLTVYAAWTQCLRDSGEKQIGETIGRLRNAVSAGRSYEELSANLQARWQALLVQNMDDCLMTRDVALHVLEDLERWRRGDAQAV